MKNLIFLLVLVFAFTMCTKDEAVAPVDKQVVKTSQCASGTHFEYNLPEDQFWAIVDAKKKEVGYFDKSKFTDGYWQLSPYNKGKMYWLYEYMDNPQGSQYTKCKMYLAATNPPYRDAVGALSITINCEKLTSTPQWGGWISTHGYLLSNYNQATGNYIIAWFSLEPLTMPLTGGLELLRFNAFQVYKDMPITFVTTTVDDCDVGIDGYLSYTMDWQDGLIQKHSYYGSK